MPYFSRVWINPLRPRGREYLQNPRVVHAAILGGFVAQPVTERVLWRLSVDTRASASAPLRAELLVLSISWPSFAHVVEEAGYVGTPDGAPLTRDYSPLLDRVRLGAEFAFRARVNPVQTALHPVAPTASQQRRLEAPGLKRGVRVAHRTVASQVTWFTSHAPSWGFEVAELPDSGAADLRVVGREQLAFTKVAGESRHPVRLSTVTVEGRLRVTDREGMLRSLLRGVGPAKAYGCGLLTLAPLRVPAA